MASINFKIDWNYLLKAKMESFTNFSQIYSEKISKCANEV